ncbi:hypothetical protein DOTSEDRAFT_42926 [Dothistroma septosporum NZE10]|uniref:Myb-like domain-containing protein n=1 Tax=Dothistroma septosporum (strain NZE10 / CBS 128990) TaxID=675120 RepID=N1PSI0_DOTSN|nr:hypothetical protein DOTSEDRAFT_42926 [Dothistroma septosporum NZE10]
MTSSQVYPTLPSTIDPEHMHTDATAGIVGTEWYAPSSYAFHDPYVTPYPSSTVESQPWTQYARASVPDISLGAYGIHQPQQQPSQHYTTPMKDPGRPRSSPSTFGPSPETIQWTTSGLGIQYTTATCGVPTPPVTSTFPPNVFQTYPTDDHYGATSPPEMRHPQPRRPYTNIAPNPQSVPKRKRDEEEPQEVPSSLSKRRKRTSSVAAADLSEDDRFLVQLKEDENLPWKDIATRFQTDKGKAFQVAALQMRYKRLREKFRVWDDQDVQALRLAHEYWEKYKWEIIGAKMLDFGVHERWPARHCARKWQDMEIANTAHASTAGMTPASISQYSSPVEGPVHFAFMPIQ